MIPARDRAKDPARNPVIDRRTNPRIGRGRLGASLAAPASATGYTIAHAGHHVRLRPAAFWLAAAAFIIMTGWSVATAAYFAFHDDVLKGLMGRLRAQQYAYEDRIAELRTQIDRTTSRQLVSQEQFQQKLDELMRRQAALESRAEALNGLADPATTGSIKPAPRGGAEPVGKPAPLGDLISRHRVSTTASNQAFRTS